MSDVHLTPRQAEILLMLGDGMEATEIAKKLWLSRETVKTHISRLFKALGAHNKHQAVAIAFRKGLLE